MENKKIEDIKDPVLRGHLETMTGLEFKCKRKGDTAILRVLPTKRTENLTFGKEYEILRKSPKDKITGNYNRGCYFVIKDDIGKEQKLFYQWFRRERAL